VPELGTAAKPRRSSLDGVTAFGQPATAVTKRDDRRCKARHDVACRHVGSRSESATQVDGRVSDDASCRCTRRAVRRSARVRRGASSGGGSSPARRLRARLSRRTAASTSITAVRSDVVPVFSARNWRTESRSSCRRRQRVSAASGSSCRATPRRSSRERPSRPCPPRPGSARSSRRRRPRCRPRASSRAGRRARSPASRRRGGSRRCRGRPTG